MTHPKDGWQKDFERRLRETAEVPKAPTRNKEMTAHQKLQLLRHLESAKRNYESRYQMYGIATTLHALKDVEKTIEWVRDLETKE